MSGRLIALLGAVVVACGVGGAVWWLAAPAADVSNEGVAELPVPPFPPRIAEGGAYENCLRVLADDPTGAVTLAETWQADGGGNGAVHCRGLALIASGQPAVGAGVLEQLAQQSNAPAMARASVLSQTGQARLMVAQEDRAAASKAVADASAAIDLSPADTELFLMRGTAEGVLGAFQEAIDDVDQALRLDGGQLNGGRPDALVLRAMMRRKLNQLELAQADVSQALKLDPDDANALLERGILRQRLGDPAGARADWEHARGVDPNNTTADLAEQNLSLLEAGPER